VATLCAALGAVVIAICTAPPWLAAPNAKPSQASAVPFIESIFGAIIGFICVYLISRLFELEDPTAQPQPTPHLATIATVSGPVAGLAGGWWGYVAALSNPAVMAGAIGNFLGAIGLALVGGALLGLLGGLGVGALVVLAVVLSRWVSR
jgi:hypothetical protein